MSAETKSAEAINLPKAPATMPLRPSWQEEIDLDFINHIRDLSTQIHKLAVQ